MNKIMLSILVFLIFFSCKSQTIKPPTNSEINKAIGKSRIQEDFFKSELKIVNDIDEGIKNATVEKKPILLFFTGYAVVNSEKIKSNLIMQDKTILRIMKENFINVWLYIDDKKVGDKWMNYQKKYFKTDFQPYFVVLNSNGIPISRGLDYYQAKKELKQLLIEYK